MTKVRMTKKLVAMATTILLLAAMVVPVIASQPNTGTITVHKYAGNSILGAVANQTGEQLVAADLAAITAAGYTPLENAEFTLYQLPAAEIATLTGVVTAANGIERHNITIVGGLPRVTFTMTDGTQHTASATVAYAAPEVTDALGIATFGAGDIPDGYYVLLETETPDGYQTGSPSLIRLPLTKADGTHNYDVHLYPKNISSVGSAVKSINGQDSPVENGDIVNFELKGRFNSATVGSAADLRNDVAVPMTYGIAEIQELFDTTFEYVAGSLTVHWLDATGEITGGALAGTFFDITTDTATGSPGGDLIVRLTPAGIDEAILVGASGFGLVLDAEYVGTPGATPGGGIPATVTNTMGLLVVAPGASITPPVIEEIFVPVLNIIVDKRTSDATGNAPLPGVTFAVAKVEAPTMNYVPGTPASAFSSTELTQLASEYVVDATGVPITEVTDATGKIIFTNLEGYTNAGMSYYLKELATADGYQLKVDTVEVVFKSRTDYATDNPTWFDGTDWVAGVQINETARVLNYELTETDLDSPGFSLPLTGGAGTLAFTAVGILVMLGAAIVYLNGKKKVQG